MSRSITGALLVSFTVWVLMSYAYLVEEAGIAFWTPLYENIRFLIAFLIIGVLVNIYAYYKNKKGKAWNFN